MPVLAPKTPLPPQKKIMVFLTTAKYFGTDYSIYVDSAHVGYEAFCRFQDSKTYPLDCTSYLAKCLLCDRYIITLLCDL